MLSNHRTSKELAHHLLNELQIWGPEGLEEASAMDLRSLLEKVEDEERRDVIKHILYEMPGGKGDELRSLYETQENVVGEGGGGEGGGEEGPSSPDGRADGGLLAKASNIARRLSLSVGGPFSSPKSKNQLELSPLSQSSSYSIASPSPSSSSGNASSAKQVNESLDVGDDKNAGLTSSDVGIVIGKEEYDSHMSFIREGHSMYPEAGLSEDINDNATQGLYVYASDAASDAVAYDTAIEVEGKETTSADQDE